MAGSGAIAYNAKLQSRVVPSSKDAEFNAAYLCISLFVYTTYEKTSRFIKGTWISTNKKQSYSWIICHVFKLFLLAPESSDPGRGPEIIQFWDWLVHICAG